MKKHLKRLAVTVTVLFAFLGAGFTVAFAADYIQWGGSQDFQQLLVNLNLIEEQGTTLKTNLAETEDKLAEEEGKNKSNAEVIQGLESEKEALITERAQTVTYVNTIISRANNANGKGNKFDVMREDTNTLANHLELTGTVAPQNGNGPQSDQLKQAEEDMEKAREKSDEILNKLSGNSEDSTQ